MRQIVVFVLAAMLLVALSSIALARGAPEKQKAFVVEQVMTVEVAPYVASVPPMTVGFDVIQNISKNETRQLPVTTDRRRQSTTGERHSLNSDSLSLKALRPELVLLA